MKNKFLILFLLKFVLLMSQNGKDNYFPPAPEASSLIKYVDVPVNYSTGVTNYSIPIHNIKLKHLNIPITLSYQSSGCKPSEIASNVGLGWELNAGGKIVQNVLGQSDIEAYGPNNNFGNLPNDRDFKLPTPPSDLFWTLSPYSQSQRDSIKGDKTDYTLLYNIEQSNIDTKPDLFYYSTPNKSGKFFFGNNFEIKQIPFGKEKIIYDGGFEIIDTDGVRYIYNQHATNYNVTENVSLKFPKLSGSSNNISYTYYLAKIITPDNETVDFIYDTVKYNLIKDKDYTRYYHSFFGGGEKVTSYYSEITAKVLTKIKVNQDYEIDFLYNKYRKDILGKVQSTAPKTLDNIKVKYENEIENFSFDYGYFGVAEGTYNPADFESLLINEKPGPILKLKSIQKTGEPPYIFSYYNEFAIDRYTTCLDHWGYYNEMCNRYTMNTLFGDFNVKQKDPDLEKSKTNVLKSIILPTKGEVAFNYELNDCSNVDMSYPVYEWPTYSVYSNEDDELNGEVTENYAIVTVPEKYLTVPTVTFNVFSEGPTTTENNVEVYLYDDQNQQLDFTLIGIGSQVKPYNGTPLIPGKKYKLVLKCKDNQVNEGKFVRISFLAVTEGKTVIPLVGGLRIQSIETKDSNNLQTIRSFEYQEDGQSSGFLYEKPYYFDEYSYFSEITNQDANANENGLISYAVQHSRIPSDLFGFNGSHIFYKKVTEKLTDVNKPANKIKTEKFFTFFDDIRYGEQSYFSKISYNWKRGLPLQINEFRNNDIVKKTMFSYKFLDTPAGTNISKYEVGFPLNNPSFPNEFYKRTIDLTVYRRSPSFYNIYQYTNSRLTSAWYYMDKKTTEENFNGKILKTEEDYKYDNPIHAQLTSQTTINSNEQTIETKYYYPDDLLGEPFMAELSAANRISTPIITEQYKAGGLISKSKTVFETNAATANLLLPKEIYSAKFPNDLPDISNVGQLERKITYSQYDDKGNVLQYTPEGGMPVSIIWGYNKTYPIAKIENATYTQINSFVTNLQNLSDADDDNCMSLDCKEQILRNSLNSLRVSLSQNMVTTYTYNPLVGVTSITDPKGVSSYYEYDADGRLKFVKDKDLNVLQKYCYNYKGQQVDCSDNTSTSVFLYKSAARSGSFTKNNCAPGGTGSAVFYSQPAGAYTSTISQADADSNGLNKFNNDGLANANANGGCIFYSAPLSGSFTKNNCAPGATGSVVSYSQAQGAEHSDSSQADADAKGLAKFNSDGLANANANGYCTFYSIAFSATIAKNNCAQGGVGSGEVYSQAAGVETSIISQEDANSKGYMKWYTEGQAYINASGYCLFSSAELGGYFNKNNCPAGTINLTGPIYYSQSAGTFTSRISQADADTPAINKFNLDGQAYVNSLAGECFFFSSPLSGTFTKTNCPPGGVGSSQVYTLAYGGGRSKISQADADKEALDLFNFYGRAQVEYGGTCTFYSQQILEKVYKNDYCPAGTTYPYVYYYIPYGTYESTTSQADANNKAWAYFNANAQAYANANGICLNPGELEE